LPRFRQTNGILRLMTKKEAIRNVGIIAHIDHGKTTMTDSLLAEAGLLSPTIAGQARALDYLEEEQKRGITIKTANISLLHEIENKQYVINLVDTPGHVDFTGRVTRALRAIDGAIVVVDAVEEVMAQTETVTKQALEELVKPVLFINKVDRLVKELRLAPSEIQIKLQRIVRDFNTLIELYGEPEFKTQWRVDPQKGTVAFGSALHKWGFTLDVAQREGVKFTDIVEAYRNETFQELQTTVPLHNAILSMTVAHLPSPLQAQRYRVPRVWKGNIESEVGQAMLNCSDEGPTVMCVTMAQRDPKAGLIATGRVFSGEVNEGDRVYLVGVQKDWKVEQVFMYVGAFRETVERISAGNIAALSGLDLARVGETLVDFRHRDAMVPFDRIKYVSEPVVTVALEPRHPKDLPRLVDAMQRLTIEDPNLDATIDRETGEYLLSGMGELHLEVAVKFLRDYAGDLEIRASKPIVAYREGVTSKGVSAISKSPNKQNKLWIQVKPLEDKVVQMIESGEITEDMNSRLVAKKLGEQAGWSAEEAGSVWSIEDHKNVLIDMTKEAPSLQEVKDMITSSFKWGCEHGPLCGEPLRGVRVEIIDAELHEDPAHRGPAQILPATRRAMFGSFLTAKPVLLEPIFKVSVTVPTQQLGEASNIITGKRGRVASIEQRGLLGHIVGFVPVAETFGLADKMRSATAGHAFWQSTFDHWAKLPEAMVLTVVREIRKRRGLPLEIPEAGRFIYED